MGGKGGEGGGGLSGWREVFAEPKYILNWYGKGASRIRWEKRVNSTELKYVVIIGTGTSCILTMDSRNAI